MTHHRAFIAVLALSVASTLAWAMPVWFRWRWRLLVAATGLLLGYGLL